MSFLCPKVGDEVVDMMVNIPPVSDWSGPNDRVASSCIACPTHERALDDFEFMLRLGERPEPDCTAGAALVRALLSNPKSPTWDPPRGPWLRYLFFFHTQDFLIKSLIERAARANPDHALGIRTVLTAARHLGLHVANARITDSFAAYREPIRSISLFDGAKIPISPTYANDIVGLGPYFESTAADRLNAILLGATGRHDDTYWMLRVLRSGTVPSFYCSRVRLSGRTRTITVLD